MAEIEEWGMAFEFDFWKSMLTPGFKKIADECGRYFVPFEINDDTFRRLEKNDDSVFADMISKYKKNINLGLDCIEL